MTAAITDAELAEWERLSSEATAGPWRQGEIETWHVFADPNGEVLAPGLGRVLLRMNECYPHDEDAAFIAAAREALPRLVGEVRRLRGERAPVAKVTECVGRFVAFDYEPASVHGGAKEAWQRWRFDDFMPSDAVVDRDGASGPRGRFRITVEFWPEEET